MYLCTKDSLFTFANRLAVHCETYYYLGLNFPVNNMQESDEMIENSNFFSCKYILSRTEGTKKEL